MIKEEKSITVNNLSKDETIVLENREVIHLKATGKILAVLKKEAVNIFKVGEEESLTIVHEKIDKEMIIKALKVLKWINNSQPAILIIAEEKEIIGGF